MRWNCHWSSDIGCMDEIRLVKHKLSVNKARICGCYWRHARSQMSDRLWRSLAAGSLWRLSEVVQYQHSSERGVTIFILICELQVNLVIYQSSTPQNKARWNVFTLDSL